MRAFAQVTGSLFVETGAGLAAACRPLDDVPPPESPTCAAGHRASSEFFPSTDRAINRTGAFATSASLLGSGTRHTAVQSRGVLTAVTLPGTAVTGLGAITPGVPGAHFAVNSAGSSIAELVLLKHRAAVLFGDVTSGCGENSASASAVARTTSAVASGPGTPCADLAGHRACREAYAAPGLHERGTSLAAVLFLAYSFAYANLKACSAGDGATLPILERRHNAIDGADSSSAFL